MASESPIVAHNEGISPVFPFDIRPGLGQASSVGMVHQSRPANPHNHPSLPTGVNP